MRWGAADVCRTNLPATPPRPPPTEVGCRTIGRIEHGHEQAGLAPGLASDSRAVDRSSPAVGDDYRAWHACRLTNLGEPNLLLPSRGIAVSTGLSF